jgi:hypothetical protein
MPDDVMRYVTQTVGSDEVSLIYRQIPHKAFF